MEEDDNGDDNNGDNNNSDDEDDNDDLGDEALLDRLHKLTQYARYKAIGKIFALKIWPWPSSNWWIGDEGANAVPEQATRRLSLAQKLDAAKKGLDAKKRAELVAFMYIEMGVPEDEWLSSRFRSQVLILHVIR